MEDQAEKMEALKKAYAEIILNTAKEAAARTMASERKALRVHHDLCNTKDEAIRMLLRFKQMIDVKKIEAETTSLSQQNRIKELDEQLNETEGVILNLRAEITKAHERLEEMKNNHMLHSDGPSENEHMHQKSCSKNCNPAKEITTSDPNLVSIIIGNKEPELYRNTYTHRIRAIEMNLVDEEKELLINADETNLGKHTSSFIDTENKDEKNINGSNHIDQTVETQRLPNRVKYAQSNHKLSRFCHEKLNIKKKCCGNGAKLTENNENNSCPLRRSIRKRKVRCWDEISSLFKSRASLSHCKDNKFEETNHEETKLLNDSVVEKESVGTARDADNKCLKYTFSRRRKKVLASESYNGSPLGKSILTGQMRKKPSYNFENKKPNFIEDSSSESQNIIDVACQLISLSGERRR